MFPEHIGDLLHEYLSKLVSAEKYTTKPKMQFSLHLNSIPCDFKEMERVVTSGLESSLF